MMQDTGRELLLLGMLRGKALSPYQIERAVRQHSPLYRRMRFGNVYHFLERLLDDGYLTRREAKALRGPSATKSILQLSAKGEARFQDLLAAALCDAQAADATLEVAIVLLGELPREDAIALLMKRRDELTHYERRVKRLFGDMNARSAPGFMAGTHALHRLQSEQTFIREMLQLLRNPRWRPDW